MKARVQLLAISSVVLVGCPADFLDLGSDYQAVSTGSTTTTATASTTSATITLCTPGEKRECYTGPEGTKGQGICKPGEQTCNFEGTDYSPCEGDIHPEPEDCATPLDEDCDGLAPTCAGLCLWSKGFGDDKAQSAQLITFDPTGAILLAGTFSGSVSFGGQTLSAGPATGTFVAKLGAQAGEHVWSKAFGGGVQSFGSLSVDASGIATAIGTFSGAVDFGGGPQNGGTNSTFVVQYDADGAFRWVRTFSGGIQAAEGVAVDSTGGVFVTGSFLGTTDFGAGPMTAKSGDTDMFLVKLSAEDGATIWSKAFGDESGQSGYDIIVDPADGNVVVVGLFSGVLDLGSGAFNNDQPGQDVFLAKLASGDASPVWVRQLHGDNSQSVQRATRDHGGNIIVVGSFFGAADLGGGVPTMSAGGADIYVTKFALSDGGHVWSKRFGQEGDQSVRGVAVDGMDNVVLTGPLSDDTDFGGGPLAASGLDVYAVKLDAAAGKHIWSKRFGDSADQSGLSVVADGSGNTFLAGFFKGSIDFGCGKLTSAGDMDAFAVELSP